MARMVNEGAEAAESAACAEEFTGAIIYCPVCCTADDAVKWGFDEFSCTNCETVYAVFLQPKIVHQHSMVG